MKKINVAVIGYGNVGKAALQAALESKDMQVKGLVRRNLEPVPENVPVVASISELKGVDVALVCLPSRMVPDEVEKLLKNGISTVDSYDEHANLVKVRNRLKKASKDGKAVAIYAAGWDPGTDSVVRAMFQAMAPKGLTYTNFGPGMSMGHSVAVRVMEGVEDALSMTIPKGTGLHRRMVYVKLAEGADPEAVKEQILQDPYFVHDETHVTFVDDVDALRNMGHGVLMQRNGVSGVTDNQRFELSMTVNNPALTGQVMVACARAATRQKPGCYTMPEVPVIDLLPGKREDWIAKLV